MVFPSPLTLTCPPEAAMAGSPSVQVAPASVLKRVALLYGDFAGSEDHDGQVNAMVRPFPLTLTCGSLASWPLTSKAGSPDRPHYDPPNGPYSGSGI